MVSGEWGSVTDFLTSPFAGEVDAQSAAGERAVPHSCCLQFRPLHQLLTRHTSGVSTSPARGEVRSRHVRLVWQKDKQLKPPCILVRKCVHYRHAHHLLQ